MLPTMNNTQLETMAIDAVATAFDFSDCEGIKNDLKEVWNHALESDSFDEVDGAARSNFNQSIERMTSVIDKLQNMQLYILANQEA